MYTIDSAVNQRKYMKNPSFFAGLHILMLAIPDGPADAGRRLRRCLYRESRCQVRTGWQAYKLIIVYYPRLRISDFSKKKF